MPPSAAPNVVEVRVKGTLDGQTILNVLHFKDQSAPPNLASMETLAGVVDTWWGTEVLTHLSALYSYDYLTVTDLTTLTGVEFTFSGNPGPGGVGGACLPNNDAFCISLRTQFRGRSFRGRLYIAGIPIAHVTQNTMNSVDANDLTASINHLIDNLATASSPFAWGILSRFSAGAQRPIPAFEPITFVTYADLTLDSQRRRLPGRGS